MEIRLTDDEAVEALKRFIDDEANGDNIADLLGKFYGGSVKLIAGVGAGERPDYLFKPNKDYCEGLDEYIEEGKDDN